MIALLDIAEMPGFDPTVPNGARSVSLGLIFFGRNPAQGGLDAVSCIQHGATLAVAKTDGGVIWRCPACNEGAFEVRAKSDRPLTLLPASDRHATNAEASGDPSGRSVQPATKRRAVWREHYPILMSAALMEELVKAAAGPESRIEWGEPDQQGYYTPTAFRESP